jgi:UDP-glucose 4-epimerase
MSDDGDGWVMVTGGAGYIGSHVAAVLLKHSKRVLIVDNFSNSHPAVIDRLHKLTNGSNVLECRRVDLMDYEQSRSVFEEFKVSSVIHLAGLKAVGVSVKEPVHYYHQNIGITCNLLRLMHEYRVSTLIHSSSATVYGHPSSSGPIDERAVGKPTSPYGHSKLFIEQIISDAHRAGLLKKVCILRYFNPVGAHHSGLIGEGPVGVPNNLMPAIARAALGTLSFELCVFGGDYETVDGTGVRDYIHVMDLACGHLMALQYCHSRDRVLEVFNLGTGQGYSVKQVIDCFERVSGASIPYRVVGRRDGDVPVLVAAVDKARKQLGFSCHFDLVGMCLDQWRWQRLNPNGYD